MRLLTGIGIKDTPKRHVLKPAEILYTDYYAATKLLFTLPSNYIFATYSNLSWLVFFFDFAFIFAKHYVLQHIFPF